MQKIGIITTDMGFKVDRDTLQQDLDEKLDKNEYYNKQHDGSNLQDAITKVGVTQLLARIRNQKLQEKVEGY